MRRVLLFVALVAPLQLSSQTFEGIEAVMKILGHTEPEEVDSDDVERLSHYLQNPLQINRSRASDLQASGLFSAYQTASFIDYRSRHGFVYSYTELAAVEGFGSDFVDILKPFICLDMSAGTMNSSSRRMQHDLVLKGSLRSGEEYAYGIKYRFDTGRFRISISGSSPYSSIDFPPSYISGNITWKHNLGQIVIGDYNARFGQGLCLWNTAVIGGLSTPSAFMKKPSGASPTYSFTGSSALTGVAGEMSIGKWKTTLMLAVPGIKQVGRKPEDMIMMPALNLARMGRLGQVSVTHVMKFSDWLAKDYRIPQMRTSCDASVCVRGVNLFTEAVYDWVNGSVAVAGGMDVMISEKLRMAALMRFLPAEGFSNEHGAAVSAEMIMKKITGNISADVCFHPDSKSADGRKSIQVKLQSDWNYRVTEILELKLRVSERLRTWGDRFRTDCRMESVLNLHHFHAAMRLNVLKCVGVGSLGYVEGGYKDDLLTACLRAGVFMIDEWSDRIYVYERDAPGNFNVPAFYGRGYWLALNGGWRPVRWCRLYLRASWTDYPFMKKEKRKPGKAELKIQAVFRL